MMDLQNSHILQPRTLAWIEQKSGNEVLPVIWFGCLQDLPLRLVVGLRSESCVVGGENRIGRFCLCLMRDGAAKESTEKKSVCSAQIVRLGCLEGRIVDTHGTLILSGKLTNLTIGQRTFSAAQIDIFRFLGTSSRVDA